MKSVLRTRVTWISVSERWKSRDYSLLVPCKSGLQLQLQLQLSLDTINITIFSPLKDDLEFIARVNKETQDKPFLRVGSIAHSTAIRRSLQLENYMVVFTSPPPGGYVPEVACKLFGIQPSEITHARSRKTICYESSDSHPGSEALLVNKALLHYVLGICRDIGV